MDAQPTNSELSRRLDDLKAEQRDMVSQREYQADLRLIDRRFTEQNRDLNDLRTGIRRQIRDETDRRWSTRAVMLTGVLPATVLLVTLMVDLWLRTHGGKP